MSRRAVFAPDADLSRYGCERKSAAIDVNCDTSDELAIGDWTFRSLHKTMLDSKMMDQLAVDISAVVGGSPCSDDHISISDHTLRLPSMVFGQDVLSLDFIPKSETAADCALEKNSQNNVIISIDASDALCSWAAQHTEESKKLTPLYIVQVPYSKAWRERSLISPSDQLDIPKNSNKEINGINSISLSDKNENEVKSYISKEAIKNAWDWTFTSDYCCTLRSEDGIRNSIELGKDIDAVKESIFRADIELNPASASEIILARALSGRIPPLLKNSSILDKCKRRIPQWQVTDSCGIDFNLLRMQNVPILFYDEILLYQDDLEDCGDVLFDAKLRVMPLCWYLLSRFFLRVDGAIARVRDTRIFHRFGDKEVHMEVTWKEQDLDLGELKSKGADVSCCESLSNAILMNPAACAEKLPNVNEIEGINKYFSLQLIS
mmetsp:Transcript_31058/g.29658  ORF Transcript_31058/g.29658 Transcript_31058/m.29658 type:complete len:435 (-) Transcript_31058:172-1476(-)